MGLGSRKFLVTMYFGTCVFALCWFNRVSGSECVTAVGILAGLYKGANLISEKMEKDKDRAR